MEEDGCFEVHTFDKVFLDEEDWSPWLFVSIGLISDTLNKWNRYFEYNLWRSEGKDSKFGDIDTSAHTKISVDIQTESIPDDSHFLVVEYSLSSENSFW